MSYTGVGSIEGVTALIGPVTIARNIIQTYDSVFTNGFNVDELPEELKPLVGSSGGIVPVDEDTKQVIIATGSKPHRRKL